MQQEHTAGLVRLEQSTSSTRLVRFEQYVKLGCKYFGTKFIQLIFRYFSLVFVGASFQ